ncbi:hypothetical protein M8998_00730 [Sphingobacterium sp. lm-10]|uniref:hypothetical protein n=1 Tax=Sphingobacterium sp. lm-10 TaxID=2944904 RepID=UPI002021BD49|nr:hypothetical protein [Sphingobacterium sp. lm-10]MCL7986454.1 hypothetical protein [Sphingobacterium sp. lm-10]
MMHLQTDVQVYTGYREYRISFTDIATKLIDQGLEIGGVSVYDVTLISLDEYDVTNSYSDLRKIFAVIHNFMEANNVILYCYCDTKGNVFKSKTHQHMSHQEFRCNLFQVIFEKFNVAKLYDFKTVILIDAEQISHYIALISESTKHDQARDVLTQSLEGIQIK